MYSSRRVIWPVGSRLALSCQVERRVSILVPDACACIVQPLFPPPGEAVRAGRSDVRRVRRRALRLQVRALLLRQRDLPAGGTLLLLLIVIAAAAAGY